RARARRGRILAVSSTLGSPHPPLAEKRLPRVFLIPHCAELIVTVATKEAWRRGRQRTRGVVQLSGRHVPVRPEGAERAELREVRRQGRTAVGPARRQDRTAIGSARREARAARRRAARRDAGRLRTCRPEVRGIRNQAHEAAVGILGHSGRRHGWTGARRGEVAGIVPQADLLRRIVGLDFANYRSLTL